jgi:site-specific recombinase XerD
MPLVRSQTQNLFAAVEDHSLVAGFLEAFEAWRKAAQRAGKLTRAASEDTYRALWGVLAKWCISRVPPVALEELGGADLEAFILSRRSAAVSGDDLTPRYVWRLLSLVDRVLAHHAHERGTAPNTAAANLLASRPEWRFANASKTDELPEYLAADQAKALVAFLSEGRPRTGGKRPALTWHELRNRASVALQLGAGLTPGDVRAVLVDAATIEGGRLKDVPWKVNVPADGVSPARETPIAPWAGQLLRHWLQVRTETGTAGPYLFPSTKTGKPWGKVSQYLAAKEVLVAAGFPDSAATGGSFRMRHTFALRQLRRGKSAEDVARWLGIVDPAVMARYNRVLFAPVDDLA